MSSLAAQTTPHAAHAAVYPIDGDRIEVAGPDAASFLNRLCTWAVKPMAPNAARLIFFLNPRGRTLAAPFLVRTEATTFALDCSPGGGDALYALLDGYLFSEDLELARRAEPGLGLYGPKASDILLAAGLPCPTEGQSLCATFADHPLRVIYRARLGGAGYDLWLSPTAHPALTEALMAHGATAHDAAALEQARVCAGVAAWPHEYSDQSTPLEVGPMGITDQKGCYPGQEVIERTVAIGRPARRLCRIRLDGPAEPGSALQSDGADIGRLTSVAPHALQGWCALALIKRGFTGSEAHTPSGGAALILSESTP
jgi:hypothetical protein